ncbi:hypothetical protein [Candidatus Marimicrobium litorale]|uniref:Glycosyl transferase family 11 n=1 Tax=Candidatus Marimicrobium litorale TaxID=2518991 RepID=A0ABT3T961_9GAMM|nr:hypothetical protein [Candidatus Marimicrobium litorale]MCX2978821.1 hypothetical protein [Candidatus Marimicrobium litorale]
MVHLQMNGFIADNLYQYVIARLIAEELGFQLEVSHSKGKGGVNAQELDELLSHCTDAPLSIVGDRYAEPVDYAAHESNTAFDGFHLDLAAIFADKSPRRLEIRGYFQNYTLLRPYKARIRRWFDMPVFSGHYEIQPGDLLAHIRWGDMVVFDLAMSLSFYSDLLQRLEFERLFVCGCGISEEVREALEPFSPIYVQGTPAEDFRFMLGFNRIIQSNSGFAWWAGFLSSASEIYCPLMGQNERTDHSAATLRDLRVDDEDRYHYVEDVPYLERDYTLRDVLASRDQLRKKRIASSIRQLAAQALRKLLFLR